MPKRKVKVEVINTYYFTPEQWSKHDTAIAEGDVSLNEYLEDVCPPQQSTTVVDLAQLVDDKEEDPPPTPDDEGESGYKQGVLFG